MKVINGNNIDILKQYPDNHFDAIVTDPPYGLGKEPNAEALMRDWIDKGYHEISGSGFMGKEWDSFVPQPIFWKEVFRALKPGGHVLAFYGTRTYDWGVMAMRFAGFEVRDCIQWLYGSGFPKSHNISKAIDKKPNLELIKDWKRWLEIQINNSNKSQKQINEECGFNAIGYARYDSNDYWATNRPTNEKWDKMKKSIGIESNEWDFICDSNADERGYVESTSGLAGGSGNSVGNFSGRELSNNSISPKAKKWDGWGSALKPANEPIVLARKPLEKGLSIAENVLKWGTGAINIDGCRVGNEVRTMPIFSNDNKTDETTFNLNSNIQHHREETSQGRFPANLILTHHPECECVGTKKVKSHNPDNKNDNVGFNPSGDNLYGKGNGITNNVGYAENGEETIENWNCHEDCPIKILDEQSGESKSSQSMRGEGGGGDKVQQLNYRENSLRGHSDKGGASRFFKQVNFEESDFLFCYLCSKSNNKEIWESNYNNVLNVKQTLRNTKQTKEHIALKNVTQILKEKADHLVKSVENLCPLCVTNFVQQVVEINNLDSNKEQLNLIRDFTQDYKKCTLLQNLVFYVETMESIDTTPTTQNLLRLFGYALIVIENYINKDIKEKEEQKLEQTRFIYQPKASKSERNKGLEGFEEKKSRKWVGGMELTGSGNPRVEVDKNIHPTVKPIKLMQYLVRLVTLPNGIVLDPFCGSGTTGIACKLEGFQFVGLEQDPEYCKIAQARIDNYVQDNKVSKNAKKESFDNDTQLNLF